MGEKYVVFTLKPNLTISSGASGISLLHNFTLSIEPLLPLTSYGTSFNEGSSIFIYFELSGLFLLIHVYCGCTCCSILQYAFLDLFNRL